MNDRSRMMLYALTAVACVMWIWQSVKESMNDGTIISTSNIIFLVCIGIAADTADTDTADAKENHNPQH